MSHYSSVSASRVFSVMVSLYFLKGSEQSALPPKADKEQTSRNVRLVPIATQTHCSKFGSRPKFRAPLDRCPSVLLSDSAAVLKCRWSLTNNLRMGPMSLLRRPRLLSHCARTRPSDSIEKDIEMTSIRSLSVLVVSLLTTLRFLSAANAGELPPGAKTLPVNG